MFRWRLLARTYDLMIPIITKNNIVFHTCDADEDGKSPIISYK